MNNFVRYDKKLLIKGYPMAKKHKHGEMDVSAQEHAFDGFIRWSIRITLISIGVLIFMAIFNS